MTALKPPDRAAAIRVPFHKHDLPLRVGTRRSPLAMIQTRLFLAELRRRCPGLRGPEAFVECGITTTGDRVRDRRLSEIGGKGLFAKEIHASLAAGQFDFAVHSLKDLETALPPGVVLAGTLARQEARDALVCGPSVRADDRGSPIAALPEGAIVGTASVRRQAQLLHARPDLSIVPLRGNVGTRLERISAGFQGMHAGLLALAGLERLGVTGPHIVPLPPEEIVPAAGQGIIAVTVRADDEELLELLGAIQDPDAAAVAAAERALLTALDGSCRTPIGGFAHLLPERRLHLLGMVAAEDGSFLCKRSIEGSPSEAAELGAELGRVLRALSPSRVFA